MRINTKQIARYLSNECSSEEIRHIEELMKSDPAFAKAVKKLQVTTNLEQVPSRPIRVDAVWQQLRQRILLENARSFYKNRTMFTQDLSRKRFSFQFIKYAAIFVTAVMLTYFLSKGPLFFSENNPVATNNFKIINVEKGERKNITLTDGSTVTVDAGSEFKYFTQYENERHVYLKGEACFNVAPDKQRPFYVHANHAIIRVVGTRFNVRSWNGISEDVITVAEGKVAVARNDSLLLSNETVMLTKGEQSTVPVTGTPTHATHIDAEQYFKWMQNEIHFVDSEVSQVVAQLERWYDYQFIFQDPALLDQSISVHIRGANIDEVIRVISVVTETKVKRNGTRIQFMLKK